MPRQIRLPFCQSRFEIERLIGDRHAQLVSRRRLHSVVATRCISNAHPPSFASGVHFAITGDWNERISSIRLVRSDQTIEHRLFVRLIAFACPSSLGRLATFLFRPPVDTRSPRPFFACSIDSVSLIRTAADSILIDHNLFINNHALATSGPLL